MTNLRFGNNPGKCCILLGPELCQNPAFWLSEYENKFCDAHSPFSGSKIWTSADGKRSCDSVLPKHYCLQPPAWKYLEVGACEWKFLCETHAKKFKTIRPSFEEPPPNGYHGQRLTKEDLHVS